jgi:hypothetical protein
MDPAQSQLPEHDPAGATNGARARARDLLVAVGEGLRAAARFAGRARGLVTRRALTKAGDVLGHLAALALTAYVFLTLNRGMYLGHIGYDEEFFAWGGWSITKGLVPYRDFLEFKPPMVFITHAIAQWLFGFKDQGYRIWFAGFPLLSLLALQLSLVARGVGRFLAMAAAIGIASLFTSLRFHDTALSDSESIGLAYFMMGLALSLWEGRFIKVTTVLGGVFLTCCVLSKEPFAPVVLFTWLGLCWMRGRPGPTRDSAKLYFKYSLAGVGGFLALLLAYMIPTGSLKAYIKVAGGYARMYRDPLQSYCVLLGKYHPTTFFGDRKAEWLAIHSNYMNETVLGYLLPFLLAGAVFTLRRSRPLFVMTSLAFLGALWAATASNCMWLHYYNMSTAGVVFALAVGLDSMSQPLRQADRLLRVGVSIAAVALIVGHTFDEFNLHRTAPYARGPWGEPQAGLMEFIAKNTTPADRIFTDGPPILYPQADRMSAVRESNFTDEILAAYDGNTDAEKLRPIRAELMKNRPKVVFLDPESAPRKARHRTVLIMPFLKDLKYKKAAENIYVRPD